VSHPDDRSFWMRYLPIAPSPPHPISGIQLVLKNGAVLEKPSYIQRVCYEVNLGVLAHYARGPDYLKSAKHLKLTRGSLKQLIQHMPDPLPSTPILTPPPCITHKELNHSLCAQNSTNQFGQEIASSPIGASSKAALWDVKLSIREKSLDNGTFEKILRLCRASDIEVSVTPAQVSAIPSCGLAPHLGSCEKHILNSAATNTQGTNLNLSFTPPRGTTHSTQGVAAIRSRSTVHHGRDNDHHDHAPDLSHEKPMSSVGILLKPYILSRLYALANLKPISKCISFKSRIFTPFLLKGL
jgi:hypothetical protein